MFLVHNKFWLVAVDWVQPKVVVSDRFDPDLSGQKLAELLMIRLVHSSNLSPVQNQMAVFVSTFTT